MKTRRHTTEIEIDALRHLNRLHFSGMDVFSTTTPLMDNFGVSHKKAKRIHKLWQNNFNERGNYSTVEV